MYQMLNTSHGMLLPKHEDLNTTEILNHTSAMYPMLEEFTSGHDILFVELDEDENDKNIRDVE